MKRILEHVFVAVVLVCLFSVAGRFVWGWWLRSNRFVSTENAYVHADITTIAPKVGGYVVEVPVDDNQRVAAGQILVRIDDGDYRATVERSRAAVAATEAAAKNLARRRDLQRATILAADAAIRAARADVKLTARNLDRASKLVGDGWTSRSKHDAATAGAVRAAAALDRAQAAAAAERARLAVLESEAAQIAADRDKAEAGLRLAEIALADTVIRAPVAGVVGNRHVREGEHVRPGEALMAIVPVEGVWVVANLKETQVSRVRVGQPVEISVDGYDAVTLHGTVDSLAPGSGAAFSLLPPDNATGNFVKIVQRVPVKIRLPAGRPLSERLVPGLSVEVFIAVAAEEDLERGAPRDPPLAAVRARKP